MFPFFPPMFGPYFNPRCIEENTLIDTPRGKVAAKDLSVGDTVLSVAIAELEQEPFSNPVEFIVGDTLTVTSSGLVETTITNIVESVKTGITYFNGNDLAKYSSEQPIFVKSGDEFKVLMVGNIRVGDSLVTILEDGTYAEEVIREIAVSDAPATVYQFSCDEYHWFIAGGRLVHNK
jgi:intein/homing endonuclease